MLQKLNRWMRSPASRAENGVMISVIAWTPAATIGAVALIDWLVS
jgi:hypothetical protein